MTDKPTTTTKTIKRGNVTEVITTSAPILSPQDIIPQDYQSELILLRDAFTVGFFRVGDIALELINLAKLQNQYTPDVRQLIYEGVGYYFGRKGRTIKLYLETAQFYPANLCYQCGSTLKRKSTDFYCSKCQRVSWNVRREYDILHFGHFVMAHSFPGNWRAVLDYSRENPEIDVDAVQRHFALGDINQDQAVHKPAELGVPADLLFDIDSDEDEQRGSAMAGEVMEAGQGSAILSLVHNLGAFCTLIEKLVERTEDQLSDDALSILLDMLDSARQASVLLRRDLGGA